jgi:enoyl-CoA hydratase
LTRVLPQLVGLARARELVFLGELIDGNQAKAMDSRRQRSPTRRVLDDAYAFAERLAARAPLSIALAKDQLNQGSERATRQRS